MTDFLSKLKEKKFFNIFDKQEDTVPGRRRSPVPGQPPEVSNQGQVPVCTSHAVGKGVVAILDGANLNCYQVDIMFSNCSNRLSWSLSLQDEVINSLIEVAQPEKTPVRVGDLSQKSISVQVWGHEEDEADRKTIKIKLWIQSQTRVNVKNWDGPRVPTDELKEQKMAMVAVWEVKEEAVESFNKYHAVYVDSCMKKRGNNNTFFQIHHRS